MAIKVDEKKCMNCHICEMTCSIVNFGDSNIKKAAILSIEDHRKLGTFKVIYCNQCGICADNCPTNAIIRLDSGYKIDADLCINCGICISVCPRDAIFELEGLNIPIKCWGCNECSYVCPVGAIEIIQK